MSNEDAACELMDIFTFWFAWAACIWVRTVDCFKGYLQHSPRPVIGFLKNFMDAIYHPHQL